MPTPDLPADLTRFILTSIPSVPHLEALLLLRAEPQRQWDAASVSRRLYLGEAHAADLLRALQAQGFAEAVPDAPGTWRYQPASAELAALLDRLAATYAKALLPVTNLIHSRMDKRARQFADAFRWRKDPP